MVGGLRRLLPACLALLAILALGCARSAPPRGAANCLACHAGIESAGPGHDVPCATCHQSGAGGTRPEKGHVRVRAHPAAPATWRKACGGCHPAEVAAVERSLHATLAGVVNQTRHLWGAQQAAAPPRFGLGGGLAPLPEPPPGPVRRPADLVDDFVRDRCTGCHLGGAGPERLGEHRGIGCAACHVRYACDGRYAGQDGVLSRERTGRAARHGLTRRIADATCLACHRANHTGADYHGLCEADGTDMFHPVGAGTAFPGYHVLRRDVHAERGLGCTDCHGKADVMGTGRVEGFALETSRARCAGCHGGFNGAQPDATAFVDKRGIAHPLPAFDASVPAHAARHARLRCSACHALRTFLDYGFEAVRRDDGRSGPDPFAHLTLRGATGRRSSWALAYRFRGWEGLVLGLDHLGRIGALRPRHQYRVSYVDGLGRVVLDGAVPVRGDFSGPGRAFMPYTPHATSPVGRDCEACHGNPFAAGRGTPEFRTPEFRKDELTDDLALTRADPPAVAPMRLFTEAEAARLMRPGAAFGRARFRAWEGKP